MDLQTEPSERESAFCFFQTTLKESILSVKSQEPSLEPLAFQLLGKKCNAYNRLLTPSIGHILIWEEQGPSNHSEKPI